MGKKKLFKCKKCEFYDVKNDACKIRELTECSKQDIEYCIDFLVKRKLIMF